MAIYRLLQQAAFSPEEVHVLATAYDDCLQRLKLQGSADETAETVAKKIIEVARSGVRDPGRIAKIALDQLSVPKSE